MIRIYGIKQCDSMKKAFAWLEQHQLAYTFHDYKKAGIDAETLAGWCAQLGWEALLNRRGTTWRQLSPEQQSIADTSDAIALMQAHTSVIKRPVLLTPGGQLLVGFDAAQYQSALVPASSPL